MIKNTILKQNTTKFYTDKYKSFIQKHDFNKVMALFSRMLLANHWKDYSFSKEKNKIIFCFHRHSYETPICRIIYERKSAHFKQWITIYGNKEARSPSLEKIIQWIESKYPKVI